MAVNMNLSQYTLKEVLDIFELSDNFTLDDLKVAKRKVASLHPDKNKNVSTEYFIFFKKAFDLVTDHYHSIKKQTRDVPTEAIAYETEEINASVFNEINKSVKSDKFQEKFNTMYETQFKREESEKEKERMKWFRDETDHFNLPSKLGSAKDMHSTIDKLRSEKRGMVIYNGEVRPLISSSGGGTSFFGGEPTDTDEKGYITCDPFAKLQYADITRVYRDEVIISATKDDFARAEKGVSLKDYQSARIDHKPIAISEADKQMAENLQIKHYLEKRHGMLNRVNQYEEKNNEIRAKFMMLK